MPVRRAWPRTIRLEKIRTNPATDARQACRPARLTNDPNKNSPGRRTMLTRRHVLVSAVAAPAILRFGTGTAHAATTLKISHQFPGGTIDKGDFRDRLCR